MSLVRFNKPAFPRWNNLIDGFFNDEDFRLVNDQFKMVPAANIEEDDESYTIKLAVPGFKKEDIVVNLEQNILTISSEKEESREEKDKNFTRQEYSSSSFKRSFTLPENVKDQEIKANYENGELVLQIPKAEMEISLAKQIEVA